MWKSIVQKALDGLERYWKKLGLMLMFLNVTQHIQPLPQKHVYQVF